MVQVIAEVVESAIEEYEEGMKACADAAKIWMQVRTSASSSLGPSLGHSNFKRKMKQ